jgi:hypothetical protein
MPSLDGMAGKDKEAQTTVRVVQWKIDTRQN